MVIGRTAGSVWSSDVAPGRSTERFASCGINRSTGSSSWKRPSSNSSSAAQDVISLVFEKMRNMWSTRKGICASLSAHPMQLTSTKSRPTSTADENPDRRFPSTYRCMAACAGRKSWSVVVTFMSSMIWRGAARSTAFTAQRHIRSADSTQSLPAQGREHP